MFFFCTNLCSSILEHKPALFLSFEEPFDLYQNKFDNWLSNSVWQLFWALPSAVVMQHDFSSFIIELLNKPQCLLSQWNIDIKLSIIWFSNFCLRVSFYCQVHNVESKWLRLLFKMADSSPPSVEDFPSQMRMTQIREMLSKAARMRRTDSGGDLMPNVNNCLVLS